MESAFRAGWAAGIGNPALSAGTANTRRLDAPALPPMFRSVSRFARMLVLFLVAAWLPVTLHCRLEAAGLYETDACCASDESAEAAGACKDDACPTVEEALFKQSPQTLKVAAPAACDCCICLAFLTLERTSDIEPALSPARHAPPPELKVAWQFLSRAALFARAPSLHS